MSRKSLRIRLALASGLAILLAAQPVFAQEQPADTQRGPTRPTDTPADRFGPFDGEEVQVSTGTDDDTLTFRVALPTGASQANRFSLIVSTPMHGDDAAMPASLDALANGSKVTLRWGHFRIGTPVEDETARTIAEGARAACRAAEPAEANNRCRFSGYAIHRYARAQHRQYIWHTIPTGATDFGIDASVGINDFEWVDPATFGQQRARHTDWAVTAYASQYFAGTAITGSVSYQRAFAAADEQQICPPLSTNPADCVTARGAAPNRSEHFLLSLGLRHRFMGSDGNLLRLAVAPQVTYDVQDDVWGVDVPVYFIPGADGGLTGGIRFGYRSDRDNEFSVGVFVGASFDFLN